MTNGELLVLEMQTLEVCVLLDYIRDELDNIDDRDKMEKQIKTVQDLNYDVFHVMLLNAKKD